MKETTFAYLILLGDEQEPSGIFTTEAEANAAAGRYLAAHWSREENRIKEADYLSEDEKEERLTYLHEEKELWEEEDFIDDLIYIKAVPMGKLISYWGNEY